LFDAIPNRRSTKEPYEDRSIPADLIAQLTPLADIITAPTEVASLRTLIKDAWTVEVTTYRTMKESVDLMRQRSTQTRTG